MSVSAPAGEQPPTPPPRPGPTQRVLLKTALLAKGGRWRGWGTGSENSLHVQRSQKPQIPGLALEMSGEEEVKLKRHASCLRSDETLGREKLQKDAG